MKVWELIGAEMYSSSTLAVFYNEERANEVLKKIEQRISKSMRKEAPFINDVWDYYYIEEHEIDDLPDYIQDIDAEEVLETHETREMNESE